MKAALRGALADVISAEEYDPLSGLVPFPVSRYRADRDAAVVFWQPAARTWAKLLRTAGFDHVRRHSRFRVRSRDGYSVRHLVHHASGSVIAGQSAPLPQHGTGATADSRGVCQIGLHQLR